MSDEQIIVDQYLYDTMVADSTLMNRGRPKLGTNGPAVYNGAAPEGTKGDFIRYQPLSGIADVAIGGVTLGVDSVYIIAGVSESEDFSRIDLIADDIKRLFSVVNKVLYMGYLITIRREELIREYPEVNGRVFRELGYRFRVWCEPQV